jgi:hypothetical protein
MVAKFPIKIQHNGCAETLSVIGRIPSKFDISATKTLGPNPCPLFHTSKDEF